MERIRAPRSKSIRERYDLRPDCLRAPHRARHASVRRAHPREGGGARGLDAFQLCRCDVCDCGQDDGRKTVSEQGVQRITSKSKEETSQTQAQLPARQTHTGAHEKNNMRTPCEKNLGRDKERTTGAGDTQNQHYQRVRTVVDSFLKLLLVLRFTGMAGVCTPPRLGSLHRNTDIHQQVVINSGRESITACVTGSI